MKTYRVSFADRRRKERFIKAKTRTEAVIIAFIQWGAGFGIKEVKG